MKKYFFITFIVLITTQSYSQLEGRRRPFGITAGLSIRNTQWKEMDYWGNITQHKTNLFMLESGNTSVFQFGFTIIPEFKSGVGIKTGIHFEFAHDQIIYYEDYYSESIQGFFLGAYIPINIQFRHELSNGLSLLAYTGPTLHYGAIIYTDEDLDIGTTNHIFGCQYSFGAGVQFNSFQFRVTTNFPFLQLHVNDYYEEHFAIKVKNPVTFSFSYLF